MYFKMWITIYAKVTIILDFEHYQFIQQVSRKILDKMSLGGVEPPSH